MIGTYESCQAEKRKRKTEHNHSNQKKVGQEGNPHLTLSSQNIVKRKNLFSFERPASMSCGNNPSVKVKPDDGEDGGVREPAEVRRNGRMGR